MKVLSACIIGIALIFVSHVALARNNELNEATPNGFTNTITITLTGDSITFGIINDYLINTPNHSGSCIWYGCFYAMLTKMLHDANEADDLPKVALVNRGYGGASSRDWDPNDSNKNDIHYLNGEPLFRKIPISDIIILYVGENDAIGFFEPAGIPTKEEFAAHLMDFWIVARKSAKYVVFVTPPIPAEWEYSILADRMRGYAEAVREVCTSLPVRYENCILDIQDTFPSSGWDFSNHPNFEGHRYLAEQYMEKLRPLIRHLSSKHHWRNK